MAHLAQAQDGEGHGLPAGLISIEEEGLGDDGDHAHQEPHPDDVGAETLGENAFARVSGRTAHDRFFPGFGGQRQPWNAVGHQVDPKDVDRQQGNGQAEKGRQKNGADLARIAGHGVFDELADVVEDPPALPDGLDDGAEIIVEQDHVGRLLGDVGAGNTHRHPDVRPL